MNVRWHNCAVSSNPRAILNFEFLRMTNDKAIDLFPGFRIDALDVAMPIRIKIVAASSKLFSSLQLQRVLVRI